MEELNDELQADELRHVNEDTVLHGAEGALDSLSLVSLIVQVESLVASELGRTVVLADEKAMSLRNSPYRSVGTLTDFVAVRLAGAAAA